MTTEVREAKKVLQDELLGLVRKFEDKFDVCVVQVSLYRGGTIGESTIKTRFLEVRVEV